MAMKISKDGEKKATFSEINITPLTDIFLVLLIIMMVIAPSFQSQNTNIKMPEINSGVSVEENNATVSITKEGEMFLNDERVNENNLAERLELLGGESEDKQVIVKADERTKSSEIIKVMRAAQDAGYVKLVVAGEPLSQKKQEELKEKGKK